MRQEVRLPHACARCGETGDAVYVQRCFDGVLSYAISFECARCHDAFVADGDDTPEDVRRALLDSGGTWEVASDADAEQWPLVARFLVDDRGLERAAAVLLAKTRSEPLAIGTSTEMKCVEQRLAAVGVKVVVRPATR